MLTALPRILFARSLGSRKWVTGVLATVAVGTVIAGSAGLIPAPPPVTSSNPQQGSCPLPAYPDATCTGVPNGVTLTAYTGPTTITTPGTVIDGKTAGCLAINAANVTIRNSRISGSCNIGVWVQNANNASLLIEDSEVSCGNVSGSHGLAYYEITARRVEITACENGLSVNWDVTVEDSYIHSLSGTGADPHSDGMQFETGTPNVRIVHNTMFGMMNAGNTAFGTSSLIADYPNHTNWLIEYNLFGGGAYTVYCVVGAGAGLNWVFRNNAFTNRFSQAAGLGNNIGAFGPYHPSCNDDGLTGNFILETGQPLNP